MENEITASNNKSKKIILIVGIFILLIVSIVAGMKIKDHLEKRFVEKTVEHFFEEIKDGYIQEADCDIPTQLYHKLTDSWNKTMVKVIELGLGGEEEWRYGWKTVLKYMQYDVTSVEKTDKGYLITIMISNKNMLELLTNTIDQLGTEKTSTVLNTLTGNLSNHFWDIYAQCGEENNSEVKGEYTMEIFKNEDKQWIVAFDMKMYGAIAGVEERYLNIFDDSRQEIILKDTTKK